MSARIRLTVLAALAAAVLAAPARGEDKVVFKDGGDLRGVVESQDDEMVVIRVGAERRRYPRKMISQVHLDPSLHPADAAPAAADAPAAPAKKPAGPAPANPPAAKPAPAAKPPAAPVKIDFGGPVDAEALARIEEGSVADQVAATKAVADKLPDSLPTFRAMIAHTSDQVRLAAASILSERKVADPLPHVTALLRDRSPVVRRTAVRLARTLTLRSLEVQVLLRVSDADRGVRTEAIRALEDLGTAASLSQVVEAWFMEEDKALKPRLLRVMKKISKQDCGEDIDAWREAALRISAAPAAQPEPAPAK